MGRFPRHDRQMFIIIRHANITSATFVAVLRQQRDDCTKYAMDPQIKHCQRRKLISPRKVARTVEQNFRLYSIHVIRSVAYFHHPFPLKNEVCLFKLMARSGGTTCRSVSKNFPVYCAETYR